MRRRLGPKKKTSTAAMTTDPAAVTTSCAVSIAGLYARRSRRLLPSTDTDENDMAAAATIGLSSQPVNG